MTLKDQVEADVARANATAEWAAAKSETLRAVRKVKALQKHVAELEAALSEQQGIQFNLEQKVYELQEEVYRLDAEHMALHVMHTALLDFHKQTARQYRRYYDNVQARS